MRNWKNEQVLAEFVRAVADQPQRTTYSILYGGISVVVTDYEAENERLRTENAKLTYQLAEKVVNENTGVLQDVINDQHTEIERLRAELAHQWQPVEDETDIDCSCDDPECTSEVQVDGSYLLAFCEGAFVQMDLGEYRICRKVKP